VSIEYRATDSSANVLTVGADMLAVQVREGSEVSDLERTPFSVPVGEWMEVTIHAAGTEHEIAINGFAVMGASGAAPVPPGGILLRTGPETAGEFDDVELIPAEGPAGPEPTPAEPGPLEPSGVPAYQAGEWARLGGPPGGLGYDIRMRPDNPDIMYVTDGFTGTYKSEDGGLSWVAINNGVEIAPGAGTTTFCATIDPHDYDTIWIGLQLSGHIYRSTDAGQTWEQRDNGLIFEDCLRSVRGITVDPNSPDVVYAGIEVGSRCWAGETVSRRQEVVRGEVYRSTDAGLHWRRVWEGENLARYIWVDPRNSDRVFVSTGIFDRDAHNSSIPETPGGVGILRSDDGGQSWTVLDQDNGLGGLYIPSLFMHPEDPDILLAAVTSPALAPGGEGIYLTRDGGDTWERILAPEPGLSMDAVEISTGDPDVWYAATENLAYRSDDAGASWQRFDMVSSDRLSGMPIDLQVDPRDALRIFVNSYNGGNMMSADGGQTWVDASQGYTGLRVHTLAVAPGAGWTVFANEFRSDDAGQSWVGTGMAGRSLAILPGDDPEDYRLLSAATYGLFGSSEDGGVTWESIPIADTGGEPLSAILAVSPSSPQTIYLGYFHWNCGPSRVGGAYELCYRPAPGLFVSQDGGVNWQAASSPVDYSITALAVHPEDEQIVYAGTVSGMYRSEDGGHTWDYMSALDPVASAAGATDPDLQHALSPSIADVLFDPNDPSVMLVATRPGAVLRSRDSGLTWGQVAAGMDPNEPVSDLAADPNRPGVFYAGSSLSGVFVSADGGDTWRAITEGMERRDVSVLALSEDGTVLYAGTASGNGGAGVWRLGTPAGAPAGPGSTPLQPTPAAPAPPAPTAVTQPPAEGAAARGATSGGIVLGVGLGAAILVALVIFMRRRVCR
jgi:photosystem II stability/assembly factor-like uncharacterized protein